MELDFSFYGRARFRAAADAFAGRTPRVFYKTLAANVQIALKGSPNKGCQLVGSLGRERHSRSRLAALITTLSSICMVAVRLI